MIKNIVPQSILDGIKKFHGNDVKIVKESYINSKSKAKFIDKNYGEWWALPTNVSRGTSHPQRSKENQKLNIKEIENRIKIAHGNLVIIDKTTYIDTNHKARFIDKDYGEWIAIVSDVIGGHGHRLRRGANLSVKFKMKIEEVKKRLKDMYGDLVEIEDGTYKGAAKKAIFIDKEYGKWEAKPSAVMSGLLHRKRAMKQVSLSKSTDLDVVKKRLYDVHGNKIKIKDDTYSKVCERATFIDINFGMWETKVSYVINGSGHPDEKWIKQAKSQNNVFILKHWKTGEELICIASYEKAVVEYFNKNKINFRWQPKTFYMPDGRTYRPDLYLLSTKKWIEIKGYFRDDALEKWNWFNKEHPNSELWNGKKLKAMGIL